MKAGTQERGTERRMEWAARYHHRTRRASLLVDWTRVDWTRVDWTRVDWTRVDWTHPKILFQCTYVGQMLRKHTYLFTKVACIACFRVFPRVGRGQRSRAYLKSFSKMCFSQYVDDTGILFAFYASAKGWSSMSVVNKCSSNLHWSWMHVTFDLYRLKR